MFQVCKLLSVADGALEDDSFTQTGHRGERRQETILEPLVHRTVFCLSQFTQKSRRARLPAGQSGRIQSNIWLSSPKDHCHGRTWIQLMNRGRTGGTNESLQILRQYDARLDWKLRGAGCVGVEVNSKRVKLHPPSMLLGDHRHPRQTSEDFFKGRRRIAEHDEDVALVHQLFGFVVYGTIHSQNVCRKAIRLEPFHGTFGGFAGAAELGLAW